MDKDEKISGQGDKNNERTGESGGRRAVGISPPPVGLLRCLAGWRSTSHANWMEGLMEAFSYPRRKLGVAVSAPMENIGKNEQESKIPSFLEACEQCDQDLVRYYLRRGISKEELNARDKTGKTGLSHACCNGFVIIVNLLRRQEVDVTLADNEGNHPIIFAAQAGHSDIVSILLNYFPGVNLDQPNHQGFTALMKAALQGRSRCAKLLLYAGGTPYARDHGRGLCALEWAEYCGRHGTAKVIAQFMEACNLGLTCTALIPKPSEQILNHQQHRHHSTIHQTLDTVSIASFFRSWRSEGSLANRTDDVSVGCMPFQLFRRVRRSLPSPNPGPFSPLDSLEEIARLCYSPVFPEYISPPSSRKTSRISSKKQQLIVPKVQITITSKDDNYYYETPLPFVRSPSTYRKYLENLEKGHHNSKKDKSV